MKFILGEKQNMTQIFGENGRVQPVTVVKTSPVVVTQIKTLENDGYDAVQVGFGSQKKERVAKAQVGHTKDLDAVFALFKENKASEDIIKDLKVGDKIDLDVFTEGEVVTTTSVSKGKGFQGVVKRHGFAGGPRTHGQKHNERSPGSIGPGGVQKVRKGLRMGGRTGSDRVTLKKVKIVKINKETGEIYLRGAIPGRRGTLVEIRG
jgi:large subunit ribosomal protein L3